MKKRILYALIPGLIAIPAAHAIDGAAVELGVGDESTDLVRVSARWNWGKLWHIGQNWNATGFWEANLGYWNGTGAGKKSLWDIGATPVFRLRPNGSPFYLEGAIGAHLLSETRISTRRSFGSSFNFGDHIGFGWNFGRNDRYELGYRFQHVSNADLAEPNDGINFHQLRLGYNYR